MKRKWRWGAVLLGMLLCLFLAGGKADAAPILTGNIDLKGADATITTNYAGDSLLTTKKDTYLLTEDSEIYSSKSILINLHNTSPVEIEAINARNHLEFRGNGELVINSRGKIGMQVGGHLRAFKNSKYGTGKVIAMGTQTGVMVQRQIHMDGGRLEGYGAQYGIWVYDDIIPYTTAYIKGLSTDGIGIWTYNTVHAIKGATVVGEGYQSGVYSQNGYIQADQVGASITGTSHNIYSLYSALHAHKGRNRIHASGNSVVREIYKNPGFYVSTDKPVHVRNLYSTVARNMYDMSKYTWASRPFGVYYQVGYGLLSDGSNDFFDENSTITGTRTVTGTAIDKTEEVYLRRNSTHEVIFTGIFSDSTDDPVIPDP